MKNKVKLFDFQKKLINEIGLLVLPIAEGQPVRYGNSIYEYEIVDIYKQYGPEEVLNLCIKKVHRSKLPLNPEITLDEHVLEFERLKKYTYYYKSGRAWDG